MPDGLRRLNQSWWAQALALLLAGALQTLTFAPFHWWLLGPLSILLVLFASLNLTPRHLFRAGWLFGVGLFGTGVSWVYVSISEYGNTPAVVAFVLTALFVAGLALFHGLAFWLWGRLTPKSTTRRLLLLPAVWILGDWLRSWLLTGFPWLYLGTAQVDGPLAGFAPVTGVYGITFWVVATGVGLWAASALLRRKRFVQALLIALITLTPWLTGPLLNRIQWTHLSAQSTPIAAMQGNIPQQIKWDPDFLKHQIQIYLGLTENDWDKAIILWPETAIPLPQDQAGKIIEYIREQLGPESTLITGIPWYGYSDRLKDFTYHNSIMAIGNGQGMYHKQRLVPFGEYVPLQHWLRGLIGFFDLPMSSFSPGPENQPPLTANGYKVMPFICYEVAYPDFVARRARDMDLLITISNDGWFGHSVGPLQHLQIARMGALETGRYMLRDTNNGLSAIIDEKGQITRTIPQFTRQTMRGDVRMASGNTPYMLSGSWPALTLAMILIVFIRERRRPDTTG